jgi:hypothetical protein
MTKPKKAAKRRRGQSASKAMLSGPARSTLRRRLKELRTLIDTTNDPYAVRIAYAMETAIRWATEHTVGWQPPAKKAVILAEMLRTDLIRERLAPDR